MLLNENRILETWSPIIETALAKAGRPMTPENKSWMSKYTHYHSLNENFTFPSAGTLNTQGMGNVTPAGAAAGGAGLFNSPATTGSGDKFPSLLPLAIQVAARTVGFDIVPVIPMAGPTGVLTYLDYTYAGGKGPHDKWDPTINKPYSQKPLVFKAVCRGAAPLVVGQTYFFKDATAVGTLAANRAIEVQFVGLSRLDGMAIFRVMREGVKAGAVFTAYPTHTLALADVFAAGQVTPAGINSTLTLVDVADVAVVDPAANPTDVIGLPALVKALEDHIQGYTGAGPDDNESWSGNMVDGTVNYEPMRRGVGEEQYYRPMGLQVFTKFIEAETLQSSANVTTEQIQDLNRQHGIDILKLVENALVNEISQAMNKHILSRAFALGWANHFTANQVEGINLNLQTNSTALLPTSTPNFIGKDGSQLFWPSNVPAYASYGGNYDNQSTLQRRIYSKLLLAGNLIAQRGRRGPANFVVTNLQIGTALQDSAAFSFAPMTNTVNQNNGSLYPLGSIAGMTVYIDPNMSHNDNRVLVGRKGADEEPGLKFCPYLLAETISTIAEGTMAPKIAVKSRYALVEAGFHPETQYVTFYVATPAGGIV